MPFHFSRHLLSRNLANAPRLTDSHARNCTHVPRKKARRDPYARVSRSRYRGGSFPEIDRRFPGGDFIRGFRRGHTSIRLCIPAARQVRRNSHPLYQQVYQHPPAVRYVRTSTSVTRTRVKPEPSRIRARRIDRAIAPFL